MNVAKRKRLEAKGWKFGSAAEFLELTPADQAIIAAKLALARKLRAVRQESGLTQAQLATRLKTHQTGIARMELGADRSVTLDILTHALLDLGLSFEEIAAIEVAAVKGE